MRDVWGIHDFVPDYSAFRSVPAFLASKPGAAPGGPSGCGFYRITQPLDALREHGWDTGYDFGRPPADAGRIIVAQRMDKHEGLPEWRRMRARHRLVYEIDDDVFSVDKTNWLAYGTYSKAEARDAVEQAAMVANLVTVTTEPLAEVMRQFSDNVAVIPNVVPDGVLAIQRPRRPRKVVIGWQGGASHARDLALVAPTLRHVLDRHAHAQLHIIGTDFRKTIGRQARYTNWIPVNARLAYYRAIDFDIALAPLTGTVFDQSKCIDSAMRICTDRGLLEAGHLEPGMKVWRDGWRKIEATEHSAPRSGLLITTEGGYQLRLTAEHRMMVNGDWARADTIAPGDRMAMEPEWCGVRSPVRIPWPADGRMSRAYSGRPAADPEAFLTAPDGPRLDITLRWGRFLGAFAGDGSVGQATMVQISCDGQDQDWIDLLFSDLRAFGLNPRTEEITTYNGTVLRRRGIRVASAHLLRVMASMGVTQERPSGKPIRVACVPEVIWRSPREVIAEFLAAYFEADGHCTHTGVAAVSKDERLIRDIQRLLLIFGITSTVCPRIHRAQNGHSGIYWHINLRRAETDVFAKEIGFRSARKVARLAGITGKQHSLSSFRPMDWSREVASVEPCMVTPVDIQVEGSEFIAAGFVSHNSAIKAIEANGLGIPVLASDAEPYRGFVKDGVNGYLCRTKADWGKRLAELVNDGAAREEMGAAGKAMVAAGHTMSTGWRKWADAYSSLGVTIPAAADA